MAVMQLSLTAVWKNGAAAPTGKYPLVPPGPALYVPRGEDFTISVLVVGQDGTPVNLTGGAVSFGLRVSDSTASPILIRAASGLTSIGACLLTFVAADTEGLAAGTNRWDLWWIESSGARHQVVLASNFVVLPVDTLSTEMPGSAQPIPPIITSSVDTVNTTGVTLASIDATRLTNGFPMFVRLAGAGATYPGAFFHIEINGNAGGLYTVDHVDVETALNLTNGQWVRNASGGAASAIAIDVDNYWTTQQVQPVEEVIDVPKYVNFDDEVGSAVANLICLLTAAAAVSGNTGTIRVRMGGTLGAADGTIIATGTFTNTSFAAVSITASSFAKPSGLQLIQVTVENSTSGQTTSVKGIRISLRSA